MQRFLQQLLPMKGPRVEDLTISSRARMTMTIGDRTISLRWLPFYHEHLSFISEGRSSGFDPAIAHRLVSDVQDYIRPRSRTVYQPFVNAPREDLIMHAFLWMTVMHGLAYAWFPKFDPAKPDVPILILPDQYTIQKALDQKSICLVHCIAGVGSP